MSFLSVLLHLGHVFVGLHEFSALVRRVLINLISDRVDVGHQGLSLVENLLALLDDASVEISLRLDADCIFVKHLLLLAGRSTSETSLKVSLLLESLSLDLGIGFLLHLNVLLGHAELFPPGVEVRGESRELLVALFLFLVGNGHVSKLLKLKLELLHDAFSPGHFVCECPSELRVVVRGAQFQSVLLHHLNLSAEVSELGFKTIGFLLKRLHKRLRG